MPNTLAQDVDEVVKVLDKTDAAIRLKMTAQVGWLRHLMVFYIFAVGYMLAAYFDSKVIGNRPNVEVPLLLTRHLPVWELMIAFWVEMGLIAATIYAMKIEVPHRQRGGGSRRKDFVTYEVVRSFTKPIVLTLFYTLLYLMVDRWYHTKFSIFTFSGVIMVTYGTYIGLEAIPATLAALKVLKREITTDANTTAAKDLENAAKDVYRVVTDVEASVDFSFTQNIGWIGHLVAFFIFLYFYLLGAWLDQQTLGNRPHVETPEITRMHLPMYEVWITFICVMAAAMLATYVARIEVPVRKARAKNQNVARKELVTLEILLEGLVKPGCVLAFGILLYFTVDRWLHTKYSLYTLSGTVMFTYGMYIGSYLIIQVFRMSGLVNTVVHPAKGTLV